MFMSTPGTSFEIASAPPAGKMVDPPMRLAEAASPYKTEVWRRLTPRERLRRSWQMRSRLPDLKAVHDRKLFPKP